MARGCGKRYIWKEINFGNVSNGGLMMERELVSGRMFRLKGELWETVSCRFLLLHGIRTSLLKSLIEIEGEGRDWHVSVLRNLNDWKINEYESLLSSLSSVFLNENYDQPVWSLSSTRILMVSSFHRHLITKEPILNSFLFRQIWKVNAPLRLLPLVRK